MDTGNRTHHVLDTLKFQTCLQKCTNIKSSSLFSQITEHSEKKFHNMDTWNKRHSVFHTLKFQTCLKKCTNIKSYSLFTQITEHSENSFITLPPGIDDALCSILSNFKLASKNVQTLKALVYLRRSQNTQKKVS